MRVERRGCKRPPSWTKNASTTLSRVVFRMNAPMLRLHPVRRLAPLACLAVACLLVPSPAGAWGAAGHRFIMGRTLDLMPPEMKPCIERVRDELVLRVVDPDLWRTVGFEEEGPNHFLDFGMPEYGRFPFAALPRDYD